MHVMTVANQQFGSASILNFIASTFECPKTAAGQGPGQRLRTVDGLVSVSRNAWAEPFDAFGNFAA